MKYFKVIPLGLLAILLIVSGPIHARKIAPAQADQKNCKMVENVTIGSNFNNVQIELKNAKAHIDDYVEKIQAIAKEQGIENLEIQNLNYNVYSNNSNSGCGQLRSTAAIYQMNGNVSFVMDGTERAANLSEKLSNEGYIVNFNMNAYRQCQ